mmetsp:Transcript_18518/g.37610  ORF Transcript_18518/g.37610 Transcript_18518/m.37610 type:complete len:95 (-) Transcript_18518:43-327(-)
MRQDLLGEVGSSQLDMIRAREFVFLGVTLNQMHFAIASAAENVQACSFHEVLEFRNSIFPFPICDLFFCRYASTAAGGLTLKSFAQCCAVGNKL